MVTEARVVTYSTKEVVSMLGYKTSPSVFSLAYKLGLKPLKFPGDISYHWTSVHVERMQKALEKVSSGRPKKEVPVPAAANFDAAKFADLMRPDVTLPHEKGRHATKSMNTPLADLLRAKIHEELEDSNMSEEMIFKPELIQNENNPLVLYSFLTSVKLHKAFL